jgi:hypothetical protein
VRTTSAASGQTAKKGRYLVYQTTVSDGTGRDTMRRLTIGLENAWN